MNLEMKQKGDVEDMRLSQVISGLCTLSFLVFFLHVLERREKK